MRPVASPGRLSGIATAVVLQLAFGVTGHAAAHGCLPAASTLLTGVPVGVLALLVVERALRAHRRSVRLAGGQATVHGLLTVLAACEEGHGASAWHGSELPATLAVPAAMLLLHVAAGIGCALLHERAQRSVDRLATAACDVVAALAALLERAAWSHVPVPVAPSPVLPLTNWGVPQQPPQLVSGTRGPPLRMH